MSILGNVGSMGLAAWVLGGVSQHTYSKSIISNGPGLYYIVTAAILFVGVLVTVIGVREIPHIPRVRSTHRPEENFLLKFIRWFGHNWLPPWRKFNFTVVFLTRSSIILGLALLMTFIEYYFPT